MKHLKSALFIGALVIFSSVQASAKDCPLAIEGNDAMQFNKKELTVAKDCTSFTVELKHAGKMPKVAMGHNWILIEKKNLDAVVKAAPAAGVDGNYVPKIPEVLASTKLVGGGESTQVTVQVAKLKKDADYLFVCTFPGHYAMMQGKLVLQK